MKEFGTSLVAQLVRVHLPMKGTWVQSLVWEDSTSRGMTEPVCYNFFFFTVQVFIFTPFRPWIHSEWVLTVQVPFHWSSQNCASLGGAGWCFSWTQVPFSLASFFFWSFSFTHFRKLSQLLECLICSIRTLILLARILPLTCLFTMMPTACWVTL